MTLKALIAAATISLVATLPVQAASLRWAAQNDILTLDPHSQNHATTNAILQHTYEGLTRYSAKYEVEPALATKWTFVSPTQVRFDLRKGVKFHDGSAFTADDVVFSFERAQHPNSQFFQYAKPSGSPRKIDDYTVEFVQDKPNPILLEHIASIYIMSKAWATRHKIERPQDFKNKEETHAARHANGTGAFALVAREPGIKTVLKRNPDWWGTKEGIGGGNVTDIIYTQIAADGTRVAALLAGQVDFVLDPPPQDQPRIEASKELKLLRGPENRVIFLGFDQQRDELLFSNVKGKNPFKDQRVRQAVYQAIDIQALRTRTMRGAATPTGGITPSTLPSNPEIEARRPYDPQAAKQLLVDAGYLNGFEVTLNCPNNRYVNDEEICIAVAAMLTRIGIVTKVAAEPIAVYFPRLDKFETSFYMLGWGGAVTDAQTTLGPVLRSRDGQNGNFNYGRYVNPKLDALIDAAAVEMNPDKRRQIIWEALKEHNAQVHHVPLHRQSIPWAMRANVNVEHRADNTLNMRQARID